MTVSGPNSARSWGTCTSPRRTIRSGRTPSMRSPSKTIRPPVTGSMPETARSVVVFLAPFAPINATISPSRTSRSISCRICSRR